MNHVVYIKDKEILTFTRLISIYKISFKLKSATDQYPKYKYS